jgi:hypothetical protein
MGNDILMVLLPIEFPVMLVSVIQLAPSAEL